MMVDDGLMYTENSQAAASSHFNALTLSRPLPECKVDLPSALINFEGDRDSSDPARLPSPKPLNVQFDLQTPGTKNAS